MRNPEPPADTAVLIKRYLDYLRLERRLSANSIRAVERDLACISGPVHSTTTQALKLVLARRHAEGLAASSLARMASSWRGFFSYLLSLGILEINPALGLKTPKLSKALPKAVGVDRLMAMLKLPLPADFRSAQAHVMIELLYCTGLRIAEALSLKTDVLNGSSEIRVTGKGNKTRVVPAIESLRARLDEFAGRRQAHLAVHDATSTVALFVSSKGSALSVRQAQKDVGAYAQAQGLGQHLHPHMLRHSFGSHVLQGTQNLRAVQELLGHASISSTQIYTALDFAHLSSVYDKSFPRAK